MLVRWLARLFTQPSHKATITLQQLHCTAHCTRCCTPDYSTHEIHFALHNALDTALQITVKIFEVHPRPEELFHFWFIKECTGSFSVCFADLPSFPSPFSSPSPLLPMPALLLQTQLQGPEIITILWRKRTSVKSNSTVQFIENIWSEKYIYLSSACRALKVARRSNFSEEQLKSGPMSPQ